MSFYRTLLGCVLVIVALAILLTIRILVVIVSQLKGKRTFLFIKILIRRAHDFVELLQVSLVKMQDKEANYLRRNV
jgi:hypothetical protein